MNLPVTVWWWMAGRLRKCAVGSFKVARWSLAWQPALGCKPTIVVTPPHNVQVYIHISVAKSSVSWSVSKSIASGWHLFWQESWFHQHVSRSQDIEDRVHCLSSPLVKRLCWKVRYNLSTWLRCEFSTLDLMLDEYNLLKSGLLQLNLD